MAEHSFLDIPQAENVDRSKSKQPGSLSRRELLKQIAGGALAGYGAGSLLIKTLEATSDLQQNVQGEAIEKTTLESGFSGEKDSFLADIEDRLGIKFVSLREAYSLMGMPFDENNREEFGDVLPMRWDHARAEMVERYFNVLPEFFHEPDGDGDPLLLTLTNFATESNKAGDYFKNAAHNLMRLDFDAFSSSNEDSAFKLLTHESVHHMQELGYSRLEQIIPAILGKDITIVCESTIQWLDENQFEDIGMHPYFHYMLRYGVQDILNEEDPTASRTNSTELEAVLGEFYVHGKDIFLDNLRKVYGNKAEDLYDYMRDSIFGGKEYDTFPIGTTELTATVDKEEELEEKELYDSVTIFENVVDSSLPPEARSRFGMDVIRDYVNAHNTEALVEHFTTHSENKDDNEVKNVSWAPENQTIGVVVEHAQDRSGRIDYESVTLHLNENGELARGVLSPTVSPEQMQFFAKNTFLIPENVPEWTKKEAMAGNYEEITWRADDKRYTVAIWPFGRMSLKKSYLY